LTTTDPERSLAPAVTRALAILSLLADTGGEPLGLADIARGIGAAKSSTSNLCQALEDGEMISRTSGGYVLGRRNVELGGAYLVQFNQMKEFYSFCERAPLLSHEVVQIAMLHGTEAVYLARHEGRAPMRLTASIGSRYPAAPTAVGNALLTTLSDAEIIERFRGSGHFPLLTERSVRNVPGLLAKVKLARERGYAIDDNEVHPGIFGIAVVLPAWMSGDQPLAMGTSLMASAATPEFVEAVVSELRDGVRRLSNPLYRAALA
jgi:IclR family transcriptional regulator, blcABC operon repressor